jgi:phage gp16-like protein
MKVHLLNDRKKKQLIAIAASHAGFDTSDKDKASTYRNDVLMRLTGKTSTTQMSPNELNIVLQHFIDRGFELTAKKSSKGNPPWIRRLLSGWKTMHDQGFLKDGGYASLETWCKRQISTECINKGIEVPYKLEWMAEYSIKLIEQLKKYHHRCLAEAITPMWHMFMDIYDANRESFSLLEVANIERIWSYVLDPNISYKDCLDIFISIQVLLNRYSKEVS